jgi:hypothetical protein
LTPYAASVLGVQLVTDRESDALRWTRDEAPAAPWRPSSRQRERMEKHAVRLQEIPDRKPSRDPNARPAGTNPRTIAGAPRPTVILDDVGSAWHEIRGRSRRSSCPTCGGRTLAADEYCLRCDRWGREGSFGVRARQPQKVG